MLNKILVLRFVLQKRELNLTGSLLLSPPALVESPDVFQIQHGAWTKPSEGDFNLVRFVLK